jgi:hypothetical protein
MEHACFNATPNAGWTTTIVPTVKPARIPRTNQFKCACQQEAARHPDNELSANCQLGKETLTTNDYVIPHNLCSNGRSKNTGTVRRILGSDKAHRFKDKAKHTKTRVFVKHAVWTRRYLWFVRDSAATASA